METGRLLDICDSFGIKGVKGIGYMQPLNYIKEGIYNRYEKAYVVTERTFQAPVRKKVCGHVSGGISCRTLAVA